MKINPGRIKTLNSGSFRGKGVLYWMQRDKRINDNWALITSQFIAIKNRVPLYVCFQYIGDYKESNIRHYDFLFKGLEETAIMLQKKNIHFFLLKGKASDVLPELIDTKNIGSLIVDFSPLKIYKKRIKKVQGKIRIPFFQVDAHNVVPIWKASDKKEFAAHTLRKKIINNLDEFLTEYPKIINHPYGKVKSNTFNSIEKIKGIDIDRSIKKVSWILPGESAANKQLKNLKEVLNNYDLNRNDPTKDSLSNLSPYFHYDSLFF